MTAGTCMMGSPADKLERYNDLKSRYPEILQHVIMFVQPNGIPSPCKLKDIPNPEIFIGHLSDDYIKTQTDNFDLRRARNAKNDAMDISAPANGIVVNQPSILRSQLPNNGIRLANTSQNVTAVSQQFMSKKNNEKIIRKNKGIVVNQPSILRIQLPNNGIRMANASQNAVSSSGALSVQLGQHKSIGQTSQAVSQQSMSMTKTMPSTIQSKPSSATTVNQMAPPHSQTMTTTASNITMPQPGQGMTMNTAQQNQPQAKKSTDAKNEFWCKIWQGIIQYHERSMSANQSQAQRVFHSLACTFSSRLTNGDPEVNADKWPNQLMMQLIPRQVIVVGKLFKILETASRCILIGFPQESEELSKLSKIMSSGLVGCIQFPQNCDIRIMVVVYMPEKKIYKGFIANDQDSFYDNFRQMYENQRKLQQKLRGQTSTPSSSTERIETEFQSHTSFVNVEQELNRDESQLLYPLETISDETSSQNHQIDEILESEVSQVNISVSGEPSNADAIERPPCKKRKETPKKRSTPKKKTTPKKRGTLKKYRKTRSANTAEVEAELRIMHETKRNDREEREHELRMKLLGKKIEVQDKILKIVNQNPENLLFNLKLNFS